MATMANEIQVEARCRVDGLQKLSEEDLCGILEVAATEVERRVPEIGPVVAIHADELTAVGSFDTSADANPFDDAEAYAHELSLGLRAALEQLAIAEWTTTARECVPA